jgi:sulfite reductase beta subunit-like hemoprotein
MGLSAAIAERVESMAIEDPLTAAINIKMSGCPNGCGQHHIANIGFTGASIKLGNRTIPAYIPHLAGNFEGGTVAMGQRLKSRLPAKRVPEAVQRWIAHYQSERVSGETFNAFVERIGTASFEQLVSDLALPPEFSLETMSNFIDWNRNEPFAVIRGEGECAV